MRIHKNHNGHWDVEAGRGTEQNVVHARVGGSATARLRVVQHKFRRRFGPILSHFPLNVGFALAGGQQKAGRAHNERADPHKGDNDACAEFGDEGVVVERFDDGNVAVNGDGHQVVHR